LVFIGITTSLTTFFVVFVVFVKQRRQGRFRWQSWCKRRPKAGWNLEENAGGQDGQETHGSARRLFRTEEQCQDIRASTE
jgi:hypothetical protein